MIHIADTTVVTTMDTMMGVIAMKSRMRNKNLTEEPMDTYDEYDLNVNFLAIQLQCSNRLKMIVILRKWLATTDKDYSERTALNEFAIGAEGGGVSTPQGSAGNFPHGMSDQAAKQVDDVAGLAEQAATSFRSLSPVSAGQIPGIHDVLDHQGMNPLRRFLADFLREW